MVGFEPTVSCSQGMNLAFEMPVILIAGALAMLKANVSCGPPVVTKKPSVIVTLTFTFLASVCVKVIVPKGDVPQPPVQWSSVRL